MSIHKKGTSERLNEFVIIFIKKRSAEHSEFYLTLFAKELSTILS